MPALQIARALWLPGSVLLSVLALQLLFAGGMGGLLYGLVLLVFVVWLLYSLGRMVFRPAERAQRAARIGIWFATIIIIASALSYADRAARQEVEVAIAAISDHKRRTGAYPTRLSDAGLNAERLRAKYSVSYRLEGDEKPVLFYSQPSMPLVAHRFNFKTGKWEQFD
jgi:hypothetical protein